MNPRFVAGVTIFLLAPLCVHSRSGSVNDIPVAAKECPFANLGPVKALELKAWLKSSDIPPIGMLGLRRDSTFVVPTGFELDSDPLPNFPVDIGPTRRTHGSISHFVDETTGNLFSENITPPKIQAKTPHTWLLALLAGDAPQAAQRFDPARSKFVEAGSQASIRQDRRLARDCQLERLYGSDVENDNLHDIDKSNASNSIIGPLGSAIIAGLAFDHASGVLYGTDSSTSNLVTIDTTDASTTIVGDTNITLPHGAAIDPADGTLYVVGDQPGRLYAVNKLNGAATLIGNLGVDHIHALDFDPTTGILYGAYAWSTFAGSLYTINTQTGNASFVADTHRINGMSFDEEGNLYASENGLFASVSSKLYLVDKNNGTWSTVGDLGVGNMLGLVFGSCGDISVCDIQMSQPTYSNGDTVTAQVFRLINPGAAIAVELKVWLGIPGIPPIGVLNLGADGNFVLPAEFDQELGPIPLFTVDPGPPRGTYEFSSRMVDPVTGDMLSEDLNPFEIQ